MHWYMRVRMLLRATSSSMVDAALVHGLTVGQEAILQGRGYRRQTLRKAGGRSGKGTKEKGRKRTSYSLRYVSTTLETLQRYKSRIRLSSSVISGFRYVSGGWPTTQWAYRLRVQQVMERTRAFLSDRHCTRWGMSSGSDSPQHQDAGLFDDPLGMEEQLLEKRQEVQQQIVPEHVGQHVQRCGGTLP
ncbi:hypothetical protein EYF80_054929 [Liparis tanakae]|uniref:Uncharacterized protein n=1 Tax=Liparis tanakae TaxID=230148 RepID=A0A4Z2F1A0_9TELE|nr:hypothetical protein EYF80_054929 [Liparis tanakae]